MRLRSWSITLLALFTFLAVGSLVCMGLTGEARAQIWDEAGTDVQAEVPDLEPPSAPILIAPANTSSHTTLPQFVWEGSTDNVGVTGYIFTVDGLDVFNDLPTTSGSGTGYSLDVSGVTFTLTVNPSLISSGTHTWKVTAFDAAGNETDSSTWTFTLDGSGPAFVVDEIDDEDDLGIDAHDPSTVPDEDDPVEIDHQHADISGTGEPGATFIIVVCKTAECDDEDDEIGIITGVVNPDGTWEAELPSLPRGKTVFLDITIEDGFGNTSQIDDLPVKLKKKTAEPLPGWTITLIPPEEIGEEIIQEIVEWWTGTLVPIIEEVTEPITKPVEEVVEEVGEVVEEVTKPVVEEVSQIYQEGTTTLARASEQHSTVLAPVLYAHLMALAALLLLPLLKTVVTSLVTAGDLSLGLLGQIFLAVGFWPDRRPKVGLVIRKEDFKPAPGVVVEFYHPQSGDLVARVVTDEAGYFQRPWGVEEARLRVKLGKEYLAAPPRMGQMDPLDWYDNDVLQLKTTVARGGAAIPITNLKRNPIVAKLLSKPKYPFVSIAMAVIITVITPTIGNLCISLFATTLWAILLWKRSNRKVTASVYYKTLTYANAAIIRVTNEERPGLYPTATSSGDSVLLAVRTGHTRLDAWTSKWEYAHPEEFDLKKNSPSVHIDLIVEPTV